MQYWYTACNLNMKTERPEEEESNAEEQWKKHAE